METKKFKTNIKCSGCVAAVTPNLNVAVGENNWNVDINNPSKILNVKADATDDVIMEAVRKAGYKIEKA
jgi:copper chaperone